MSARIRLGWVVSLLPIVAAVGCVSEGAAPKASTHREPFVRPLPDAQGYTRLLSKDDAVGMRSGHQALPPGQECGWHSTDNYEELIICLAGSGELLSEGGGRRPLTAGTYGYNPPHTRHNVVNTGTEVLRYIYVVAPAAVDAGGHH